MPGIKIKMLDLKLSEYLEMLMSLKINACII
jgi:hypothetical protein